MFGKFKDLYSCKKACEITPTCFSGDFNPWLGKCYLHGNITACATMRSHKAITHFKKIPCGEHVIVTCNHSANLYLDIHSYTLSCHFTHASCHDITFVFTDILESTRGFVILGVSVINGIEIKGVKCLSDCIKKCATAGGGVAALATTLVQEGQVCCHIDYDFATHKCYFHPCGDTATAVAQFCPAVDTIVGPPLNSISNPTTVSITICEYYFFYYVKKCSLYQSPSS